MDKMTDFKAELIELTESEHQMIKDAESFSSDGSIISIEG